MTLSTMTAASPDPERRAHAAADRPVSPPSPRWLALLRRWGPWLVGLAIVGAIAASVPFAKFGASLGHGPHAALAATELMITTLVLFTDSFSTWIGLRSLRIRWAFPRVMAVRGATFLLFLINYALGQGGFGYYLYRAGEPALRAVGATLFLIGTNLAALLVLTFGVWAVADQRASNPAMWWTIVVGMMAFAAYLVVIAVRPGWLARRGVFAALFDGGLGAHAIAIAGRVPHVIALVLAHWVAMRVWGFDVPLVAGIVFLPAVTLAAVMPISPAGLGTTQAAMLYFFRDYAPGATADDRAASLLAFAMVHFVYGVLAGVIVGLGCLPFAKRTGLLRTPADEPAAPAAAPE